MDQVFASGRTPLLDAMQATEATFKHAHVTFAYAGGLARSFHGKPASTEDVDFIILAKDLRKAEEALIESGFHKKDVLDYSKPKRMIHKFLFGDREIDLLVFPQHEDFIIDVMNRAQEAKGLGKVVSLEDLILLKLFSFRLKDKAHIVEVIETKKPNMDYIKTWCINFDIIDRYAFLLEDHGES
jgi:hypothetical protein